MAAATVRSTARTLHNTSWFSHSGAYDKAPLLALLSWPSDEGPAPKHCADDCIRLL